MGVTWPVLGLSHTSTAWLSTCPTRSPNSMCSADPRSDDPVLRRLGRRNPVIVASEPCRIDAGRPITSAICTSSSIELFCDCDDSDTPSNASTIGVDAGSGGTGGASCCTISADHVAARDLPDSLDRRRRSSPSDRNGSSEYGSGYLGALLWARFRSPRKAVSNGAWNEEGAWEGDVLVRESCELSQVKYELLVECRCTTR